MRYIYLDTGPLGAITNPSKSVVTLAILQWVAKHLSVGNQFYVPAIADFEVRRELTQLKSSASIASLDIWNASPTDRYLPIDEPALRLASTL
jgi:hypothetical protein